MNTPPFFSLIIPVYNLSSQLIPCLDSLVKQNINKDRYEIIIIDDCSKDNTLQIAKNFLKNGSVSTSFYKTESNSGPGAARNIGIEHAVGEWVIFIDGDDSVSQDFLRVIHNKIQYNSSKVLDCIAYNWCYQNPHEASGFEGRKDFGSVLSKPLTRAGNYLSMSMDGSVIYTAMRRSFLNEYFIRFDIGLHEDIDMIFKVYFHAKDIDYIDTPIYQKFNRSDSIVNTISKDHVRGYLRAWAECIAYAVKSDNNNCLYYCTHFSSGVTGSMAIIILKIYSSKIEPQLKKSLYDYLYQQYNIFYRSYIKDDALPKNTYYDQIANAFIGAYQDIENNQLIRPGENNTIENAFSYLIKEAA